MSYRILAINPGSTSTKIAVYDNEKQILVKSIDHKVEDLEKYDKVQEFTERYKEDGIIWFIEACDLNVFAIRRAMWQMEEAGWFQYVKGFLIGRPLCFGQEMMGLDQYQAVLAVAGEKNVPVIMDMDLGHLAPMMPIVTGSLAEVRVCDNDITIRYDYR